MTGSRTALVCIALVVVATGCGVSTKRDGGGGSFLCPQRPGVVEEAAMSCTEANRVAVAVVKRLGYTITDFSAAAAGQPGSIEARRGDDWGDPSKEETAAGTIVCSDSGSRIEVTTSAGCAAQLTFPARFREAYTAVAARKVRRPSLVPKEERTGLQVAIEPLRRGDGGLGVDLAAAGLMPVKLTISNRTARTYTFDPAAVVLVSEQGERVTGISAAQAAKRTASATTGAGAADRLGEKAARAGVIAPGEILEGYLYVPRQAYRRARLTLIDQATEETEGFAVGF